MKENITTVGVNIGEKHTARDYGLILTSRPDTGSPKPKTYSQDIPGADGVLDLTEATTGEVKFSNRTLTIKAKIVLPYEQQEALKSQILGDCHGRKLKIILDEDPERYYYGRVTVTFPQKAKDQLYVTFTVDAEPYKKELRDTEIEVTLEDVASAQDIPLGVENNSTLANNAEFLIPAGSPLVDFSQYTGLCVKFPQNSQTIGIRTFQVQSGDGGLYSRSITAEEISARRIYVSNADLTTAGVDTTDIRRVLSSGFGSADRYDVQLCAVAMWGFIRLINGQMSVVPEIYCPVSNTVRLNYNGRTYLLDEGWNKFDEMLIPAGMSQYNVVSGANTTIKIKFRRGWL